MLGRDFIRKCPRVRMFPKTPTVAAYGHVRKRSNRVAQIAAPDTRPVGPGAFQQRGPRSDPHARISIGWQFVPFQNGSVVMAIVPLPHCDREWEHRETQLCRIANAERATGRDPTDLREGP